MCINKNISIMYCYLCNKSNYKKVREDLSFHQFPKSRYNEWLRCLQMDDTQGCPDFLICSDHFRDDCFERGIRIKLKRDANPTIINVNFKAKEQQNAHDSESTISLNSPERMCPADSEEDPLANSSTLSAESTISLESPKFFICESGETSNNCPKEIEYEQDINVSSPESTTSSQRLKISKFINSIHSYSSSVDDMKKKLKISKDNASRFRKKFYSAQAKVKKLQVKVVYLKSVIATLKKQVK